MGCFVTLLRLRSYMDQLRILFPVLVKQSETKRVLVQIEIFLKIFVSFGLGDLNVFSSSKYTNNSSVNSNLTKLQYKYLNRLVSY